MSSTKPSRTPSLHERRNFGAQRGTESDSFKIDSLSPASVHSVLLPSPSALHTNCDSSHGSPISFSPGPGHNSSTSGLSSYPSLADSLPDGPTSPTAIAAELGPEDTSDSSRASSSPETRYTHLLRQELRADGGPRRPMNSFMIFARHRRPQLALQDPTRRTTEISKVLSAEWKALPAEQRAFFNDQAQVLLRDFKSRYPDYVYTRAPNNSRRKSKAKGPGASPMSPTSVSSLSPSLVDTPSGIPGSYFPQTGTPSHTSVLTGSSESLEYPGPPSPTHQIWVGPHAAEPYVSPPLPPSPWSVHSASSSPSLTSTPEMGHQHPPVPTFQPENDVHNVWRLPPLPQPLPFLSQNAPMWDEPHLSLDLHASPLMAPPQLPPLTDPSPLQNLPPERWPREAHQMWERDALGLTHHEQRQTWECQPQLLHQQGYHARSEYEHER